MTAEPVSRSSDPGTVDAENPWPGLAAFREADQELFYGRETETEELLRLVLRKRLTVLFGLSGLGKTSLLQAGLFPRLRPENVLPVYIRLDFSRDLIDQVRQSLLLAADAAGVEAPAFSATETLWESFHRQGSDFWSPRNDPVTPLLVFDQFEEIFTIGRLDEAFLTELADLCEGSAPESVRSRLAQDPASARDYSFNRHPYKILLSLREDFLPELEGLRGRIRGIVHNRLRLQTMHGSNALRVVTEAGGHLVEPDVPEKIVRFVAGRESGDVPLVELEVEPALLSVICRELNHKRRNRSLPKITAELLEGNREEILSDFYERSLVDLASEVRTFIEERLLTPKGLRDSVALESAQDDPAICEVLHKLTDRRLLRIEDRGGAQRVELTHDVLAGVIRKSRDSRREREARERAETARREAVEWARESRRKLRRSRVVTALMAVLLLGVTVLTLRVQSSEKEAQKALASSDVERAWNLQSTSPAHALAYLARALRSDRGSIPAQSLLTDLLLGRRWLQLVAEKRFPEGTEIFLGDDGLQFVTFESDRVRVWDSQTFRQIGRAIPRKEDITSVDIGQGGQRILIRTILGKVELQLWDTGTPRLLESADAQGALSPDGRWLVVGPPLEPLAVREVDTGKTHKIPLAWFREQPLEFSPDSRKLLAYNENSLTVLDLVSGHQAALEQQPVLIDAAALSADGRRVVTVGLGAKLWDAATGRFLRDLPGVSAERAQLRLWLTSENDRLLTARSLLDKIDVWRLSHLERLAEVNIGDDVSEVSLSRDGQLALAMSPKRIALVSPFAGSLAGEVPCNCAAARFVAGARRIVTVDEHGVVRLWTFAPAPARTELLASTGLVTAFFSRDGSRLGLWSGESMRFLDTDSGRQVGAPIPLGEKDTGLLLLTHDGRRLVSGSRTSPAGPQVWDTGSGLPAWPRVSPAGMLAVLREAEASSLSPDGKVLALLEDTTGSIDLWNLETGHRTGVLKAGPQGSTPALEFSPRSDRFVTSSEDGTARLWSVPGGDPLGSPMPHDSTVDLVDFSEDGERIATVTESGDLRIWDARSGASIAGPFHHPQRVRVRFEAGRLLTWSDKKVLVRDPRTGRPLSEIELEQEVDSVHASPDGARLLIQTGDLVWLMDARTGRLLRAPVEHESSIARLSPNGQLLWIATQYGIHVLPVPILPARDGELLARWAEAVGGYTLDEDARPVPLADLIASREALRQQTDGAPRDEPTAAALIRWFFADPDQRTISPALKQTVEEFLRSRLEEGTPEAWDEAAAAFPGHPLLRKHPRPLPPTELP